MYTENYVKELVDNHNKMIDNFIYWDLAGKLGAKNGKIKLDQWFKAQAIIKEQNFYEKGMVILKECRKQGFDVKMDMQADKLVYYGKIR